MRYKRSTALGATYFYRLGYYKEGFIEMRTRIILFGVLLLLTTVHVFAQENKYTEWMTSRALKTVLHEMSQDRMFPGTVEGRLSGEKIQYRAQFIPFLHNMDYFQSRWGMTENWYKSYSVQLMKTGFAEFSHTTFVDRSGTTLHQATWVLLSKQKKQHNSSSEKSI